MENSKNKKSILTEKEIENFRDIGILVYGVYSLSDISTRIERKVADYVRLHGETEAVHTDFIASILSFVHAFVAKEKTILAMYTETPAIDFGIVVVVELITSTIYELQKKALGLEQSIFSHKVITFDIMEHELRAPIDTNAMRIIMERVEHKTTASLSELELDKTEDILIPGAKAVGRFEFHKILTKVILNMDNEKWPDVGGVDFSCMLIACYDIANRIYNKYTGSSMDAD